MEGTPRNASVADALDGTTALITGTTGFVAKAVLATLLREVPGLKAAKLVIRASDDAHAEGRMRNEVLGSGAFQDLATAPDEDDRITAIAGDLTKELLGRTPDQLASLEDVDLIIHCAASVSFENPLDLMIETNVLGAVNVLRAARAAGADPHVVQVSTAYAAGTRTGLVLERPGGEGPVEPDVDLEAELQAGRAWREQLESDSRLPEHQRLFVRDARQELGPAGAPAIGARAEKIRKDWVTKKLVERGRERSRALGWADAYALSKALGERAMIAEQPRLLSIVRPSIVESAYRDPFPGWLEGLKVADPIILAYARGLVTRFPGNEAARLDVVPVDFVANACVSAAARPPEPQKPRVIAITSGARNPLILRELADRVHDYFQERPLADEEGLPVEIAPIKFGPGRAVMGALDRGDKAIFKARNLLDRIAIPRADEAEKRLHKEQRKLERLRRLAEIYGPYVELDCVFDDRQARELAASLTPEDRERLGFDIEEIDWEQYLTEIHLPALRDLVNAFSPTAHPPARPVASGRPAPEKLPDGPPGLAVFDVEGVILDATVAHFYAWLRGRTMPPADRAVWLAGLAARAPGFKVADRQSRAAFNRSFYREYRGLPAAELREEAQAALSDFILPRVRHAAIRRIRQHRIRGDRVVLVTGALDFLIAPLAHLADELVAARLNERRGAFTGELAEPPLTADGRASVTARLAAEHGVDLRDCFAYGDSISDLPMLELVGHPNAVNPDFRLAREARRRRWAILEWDTEPGAKTGPPAPVEVRS